MSTDQVDAALQGLRDTLEADGYALEWSLAEQDQVGGDAQAGGGVVEVRVVPGADACADCLVPAELMRSILSDALRGTPYRVGSITLPDKSS
jgi:hypothetical protein